MNKWIKVGFVLGIIWLFAIFVFQELCWQYYGWEGGAGYGRGSFEEKFCETPVVFFVQYIFVIQAVAVGLLIYYPVSDPLSLMGIQYKLVFSIIFLLLSVLLWMGIGRFVCLWKRTINSIKRFEWKQEKQDKKILKMLTPFSMKKWGKIGLLLGVVWLLFIALYLYYCWEQVTSLCINSLGFYLQYIFLIPKLIVDRLIYYPITYPLGIEGIPYAEIFSIAFILLSVLLWMGIGCLVRLYKRK